MIIDSHIHISYFKKQVDFKIVKKRLLAQMVKFGIDRALVIPDNVPNTNCADMEEVKKLTSSESRLFLVATLSINNVNTKSVDILKSLFRSKQAYGFKIFPGHDPIYPTDRRWDPVYEVCQKFNQPLIIHTGINSNNPKIAKFNDPAHIVKTARRFSNLKIIIAHYFWPKLEYCFQETKGFSNIYFDTSVMADPEVVRLSGGIKKVREILTRTVKRRPNSLIFGTDWPIGEIAEHLKLINSLELTPIEKENVLFKNAKKVFGIK